MVKHRPERLDAAPDDTAEARLDRLVASNARVQAELKDRLGSPPGADVERRLLKAIINQIPELVYAKDVEGRFLTANDAVAQDIGMERSEDLIGKTDFDLFPPEVAQGFHDIEQEIIKSEMPVVDMEEERTDAAGASKWLLTTKLPMKDDRGETVGLIGVARNITERKRAEQELKAERTLFRAMIDQVPDYLFVKDNESRFVVVNRAVGG